MTPKSEAPPARGAPVNRLDSARKRTSSIPIVTLTSAREAHASQGTGGWTFSPSLAHAVMAMEVARLTLQDAPDEVITRRVNREFVLNRRPELVRDVTE